MQVIAIHPPHHNDAGTIISEEHGTPCRASCDHEPNARGTACEHCGLTAELVTPDELAEAMMAEVAALRLAVGGQTSWLDLPIGPAR